MVEPFLVARNLHESFDGRHPVRDVSFTIEKGEIFGLLGPNVAGKTTIIGMLSTVLPPGRGDVTIGAISLKENAAAARRLIGVCPQDLALYQDHSALDNLIFFGRMEGLSGEDRAPRWRHPLRYRLGPGAAGRSCRSVALNRPHPFPYRPRRRVARGTDETGLVHRPQGLEAFWRRPSGGPVRLLFPFFFVSAAIPNMLALAGFGVLFAAVAVWRFRTSA